MCVCACVHRHRAYLHKLVRFKEVTLQKKRGKVPGTPGLALQDGKGMVPLADTMVSAPTLHARYIGLLQ